MLRGTRSRPPTAAMTSYLREHPDLAGWVLGTSGPDAAEAFAAHLAGCAACQAVLKELECLPDELAETAAAVELPSALEARVLGAVRLAAARQRNRRVAAADPPRCDPVPSRPRRSVSRHRPRRRYRSPS